MLYVIRSFIPIKMLCLDILISFKLTTSFEQCRLRFTINFHLVIKIILKTVITVIT